MRSFGLVLATTLLSCAPTRRPDGLELTYYYLRF
jgi:hypothetical protein